VVLGESLDVEGWEEVWGGGCIVGNSGFCPFRTPPLKLHSQIFALGPMGSIAFSHGTLAFCNNYMPPTRWGVAIDSPSLWEYALACP
jgi:hypothetical protein